MKEESGRILKRPVLSVLVAAALYTPQVMAFTEEVTGGSTVTDETVENGTQYVLNKGKTDNITVGVNGHQFVYGGGITNSTVINEGGKQWVYSVGTATNTIIKQGGALEVDGGKATGVEQQEGAALIATTDKDTVVSGNNTRGEFSINAGQAENVLLENGGWLTVVNDTSATDTTIRDGGYQYVESGGTATGTTIDNGGLMQNVGGKDSGTTVKDGGVYELGRYNAGFADTPDYRYHGLSSASDLSVETGGRAAVYAGTLSGATVKGANASLTLMTPQTETADGDLTLSLTGKVSVTEGGRLVSQRGADMSGAELTLSSQGGLILKGDTGCPEEGCSWTVKSLTLDNGAVAFYDTAAVSDGGYQSLTTGSLSGNGNFYMHTNVAAGQGDRLIVTGTDERRRRGRRGLQSDGCGRSCGSGMASGRGSRKRDAVCGLHGICDGESGVRVIERHACGGGHDAAAEGRGRCEGCLAADCEGGGAGAVGEGGVERGVCGCEPCEGECRR